MNSIAFGRGKLLVAALACLAASALAAPWASAAEVLMKDGRLLRGKLGKVGGLADLNFFATADDAEQLKLIVFLDDDLRRTFVPQRQIQEVRPDSSTQIEEKFHVRQRAASDGPAVRTVGPILHIQPFDEFGRRIVTMNTARGPVDIIQGITEITPQWTKVEGITYMWDMRIATSSIPRDVLHKVLLRQAGDAKNIDQRKRIARFFLQAERFKEAREELEAILAAYPESTEVKEQLAPTIRSLRQLDAQRLLGELKQRRAAGQHELVLSTLKRFPSDDVAGETLQAVRELIQEYAATQARRTKALAEIAALLAKAKDPATRRAVRPLEEEIAADLGFDTLDRMAAFLQNADDPEMSGDDKLALAISGWLLGPDAATTKLSTALSLARVRDLIWRYLADPLKLNRVRIGHELFSEEAATPQMAASLLAHMKPPGEPPEPVSEKTPGYFEIEVPVLPKESPRRYFLQLPPEYNPYRRYPMIISLHDSGSTAPRQIDWWAGSWGKNGREGQAARCGYIVMAPEWTAEHQDKYGYSAHEHAVVLACFRDACRRFAVDTDRVFLSGHGMGGDAVWDIGLAHPDLWAGVIPVGGESDRFCSRYTENAKNLPFYLVCGELDDNRMAKNSRDLNRYLQRGYNATVVEYLGRGREHFYEEILRLFDWMGRFHRDFFPREFTCTTMREGDNFFWWVELAALPPRAIVNPSEWPPPRNLQPVQVKANVTANNNLSISTGAGRITVWLAAGMLDFKRSMSILVNGRKMNNRSSNLAPNLDTMLEDVRTRGDRQHPFWAKFECPTGRLSLGQPDGPSTSLRGKMQP